MTYGPERFDAQGRNQSDMFDGNGKHKLNGTEKKERLSHTGILKPSRMLEVVSKADDSYKAELELI